MPTEKREHRQFHQTLKFQKYKIGHSLGHSKLYMYVLLLMKNVSLIEV